MCRSNEEDNGFQAFLIMEILWPCNVFRNINQRYKIVLIYISPYVGIYRVNSLCHFKHFMKCTPKSINENGGKDRKLGGIKKKEQKLLLIEKIWGQLGPGIRWD